MPECEDCARKDDMMDMLGDPYPLQTQGLSSLSYGVNQRANNIKATYAGTLSREIYDKTLRLNLNESDCE